MNPIKLASTFSGGFGSINFAFKYENIEYKDIFAVELMKTQRESYILNHGEPKEFAGDITKFDGKKYKGKIDFLSESPSCKKFSMAGSRCGLGDEDGRLMFEAIRVIDEVQPKIFVIENVASITSSRGGEDWKEILKAIRSIPGYTISYGKMNAKHYGGIQNRDRMFIVGFRANCYPMPFPERIERKYKLADFLEDEVDEKYYLSDKMIGYFTTRVQSGFDFKPMSKDAEYSKALTSRYMKMGATDTYIKEELNQVGSVGGEVAQKHNSAWARVYDTNGVAPAQVAHGGGGGAKTGLFLVKSNTEWYTVPHGGNAGGWRDVSLSPSITTSSWEYNNFLKSKNRIRKLTEREAARVMGDFDDKFNLGDFSMSKRYEFIGNAIEINTYRHLLRQILKHAEGLTWNEPQEPSFAITEPKQQLNLFGE